MMLGTENYQVQSYQTPKGILETVWYSDIGTREKQEDACRITFHHDVLLATVCDGIGGAKGGEIASTAAITCLHEHFLDTTVNDERFYTVNLEAIDAEVYFLKNEVNRRLRAGTTIASVMIPGNQLYWFSVGDSRVYILRNHEMIQATNDHNYQTALTEMLHAGRISLQQYQQEEQNFAALTSYVGIGGVRQYDICAEPFQLHHNDLVLITSDGLYHAIPMDIFSELSEAPLSKIPEKIALKIQEAHLQQRDNTTFILIRYKEVADNEAYTVSE